MGWTDVRIESFEEKMKLLRLWDNRGLLALFSEPHTSGFSCRVFNAHKPADTDFC